jgi:hypothetical protein
MSDVNNVGTLRSFGIIYAELLETYHVGAGYTAIILSIVIFLVAVGGMSHIKTRYNNEHQIKKRSCKKYFCQ